MLWWKNKKADYRTLEDSLMNIVEEDRFSVVRFEPEDNQWVELCRLDKFPHSHTDIPNVRPGDKLRVYDSKNPKKLLKSITVPGKQSETKSSERKSAMAEIGENVSKAATEIKSITTAVGELNQALVVPNSGITKEDLRELIEELRKPQGNDFKTQLKSVVEVLKEFKEADKTIKSLAGGENSDIPEKILEKMDGWPLLLYYPPSRTIQELKDAGKEMLEHAIKTAKGELTGQEGQLQGESIFDKYRKRKMQKQGGG